MCFFGTPPTLDESCTLLVYSHDATQQIAPSLRETQDRPKIGDTCDPHIRSFLVRRDGTLPPKKSHYAPRFSLHIYLLMCGGLAVRPPKIPRFYVLRQANTAHAPRDLPLSFHLSLFLLLVFESYYRFVLILLCAYNAKYTIQVVYGLNIIRIGVVYIKMLRHNVHETGITIHRITTFAHVYTSIKDALGVYLSPFYVHRIEDTHINPHRDRCLEARS